RAWGRPGRGSTREAQSSSALADKLLTVSWIVALGGALAALLVVWLLRAIARGRSTTLRLAGPVAHDLERSEQHTHQILETAHDAFVSMDNSGHVTHWNAQAEAIFGWPRKEALGRELAETIIPQNHRDAHRRGLAHFLATGE